MELWDAYNKDYKKVGKDLVRGDKIPNGLFHLVVGVIVKHADGSYLITTRDPIKEPWPGYDEIGAGGSAVKGEDALTAAKRELEEETGLVADELIEIKTTIQEEYNSICASFLYLYNGDKNSIKLQNKAFEEKRLDRMNVIRFILYMTSSSTAPINPCWTRQTFGSTTNYPYPSSTAAINGNRGLYFYSYGSTPVYEYAALPMFESDLNVLRIRFNSKRYSTVGSTYFSKIYVGVMSNPDDISTFDTVALIDHTADPASTITAEEIFFDQYDGEGGYIAFLHPALGSSQYNYIYIDDIVVDSIPSCRRSTNLVAENQ